MKKINALSHNIIIVNQRIKETVDDKKMNDRWLKVFNSLVSELFKELADPSEKGVLDGVQVL
ncbi:hypothetical protein [Fructilactobacillus lindneri]|uniref:Uncharacterized protein n=1 Tax=Fructilactobacillus lindneri DSM 20690 = JCM 11027 TaxID=1122148 RepID=A0A0R2JM93_9LACO|nr:hypothetical protein [Fructilactobacillus lindneri]KRN78320.1 hypothetical protein IV52_GL001257 [Fructilactobacillus lindneri DSM 20690 = JCM 11027]POH05347.1 hypothetical protein BGL35_06170 [Fructilactobacillus lindneri]POH05929.1 hypothetical protein BGL36_05800 [Fructilactobacillus lindneri]POH22836.1 hypothetical protein BHU33_06170 [Fructilactobacillus lindneri DSM 20690 = JCM 11027]SKA08184.1 hypothetical protein SAMN02746042_01427 [Fructilactobacillus lindneri DSM 20690 = JCM 11027